jgi:hypothetical protein
LSVTEEQKAVALIFDKLSADGLQWYKQSGEKGVAYFTGQIRKRYTLLKQVDVGEKIRWNDCSQFADRHIVLLCPPDRDPEPLLAMWCKWDFSAAQSECHFYIGLWTKIAVDHNFVGYRFESPHAGEQHDFFHCQPCRNLGNRSDPEGNAVSISEYVPTLALHADNNAELALNIILAMRGKAGLGEFKRSIYRWRPEAAKNAVLVAGFKRLLELGLTTALAA